MKHIVNISGGLSSWMTGRRVVERYGIADVTLLFADVKMEDSDLYRFLAEAVADIGVPLTTIADGRTPWDVFRDNRFLGNSRVDLCSRILKRELLNRWHADNCDPADTVIYVGLRWDEADRFSRFKERMAPWNVQSPLLEPPYLTPADLMTAAITASIAPPRLNLEGFPHNNCGGFCVKAGQGHFVHLLAVRPETYAYHEAKEEELRQYLGKNVSICKDRRGGKTKPLTLKALRERVERGEMVDRFEWGGCGCSL